MQVTFFGHWDTPRDIRPLLEETIIDLIENYDANIFYVGNQGAFDGLVLNVLRCLKLDYPHIVYAVVLPYCPIKKDEWTDENYYRNEAIFPEGLEKTPPRFAILKRNRWMIDNSDTVVTYVTRIIGGAAQAKEIAERKGKRIINLPDLKNNLN